jgi:hypothetical protein
MLKRNENKEEISELAAFKASNVAVCNLYLMRQGGFGIERDFASVLNPADFETSQ